MFYHFFYDEGTMLEMKEKECYIYIHTRVCACFTIHGGDKLKLVKYQFYMCKGQKLVIKPNQMGDGLRSRHYAIIL